ncbi:major capsid protein [Paracoccus sp. ME4]|uniref:major capsid protein n=1 Tax=Paracoccus sp. ME4 TaxID=3138066 RepID=UPI00398B5361
MGVPAGELANAMNDKVEEWQRGFDRLLILQGMQARTPNVTLPSPEHLQAIPLLSFGAFLGIPAKILIGSQTGEIAGTIKLLRDANIWAPVTVYLNAADWFHATNIDHAANCAKTIAQRIREIEGIAALLPAPTLASGQIIALVKDRRVLQVLNAMPVTTRAQFQANPEDE